MKDQIVEKVKQRFDDRSKKGIEEYKTTLQDNPDGFWRWIDEIQTELMDATLYLEKLKSMR